MVEGGQNESRRVQWTVTVLWVDVVDEVEKERKGEEKGRKKRNVIRGHDDEAAYHVLYNQYTYSTKHPEGPISRLLGLGKSIDVRNYFCLKSHPDTCNCGQLYQYGACNRA